MKIKKGFELRDVCGEKVVLATGIENVDFSKLISLNESAAYLWEAVADTDFDVQDLARLLSAEYEVNADTALADAAQIMKKWEEYGIIA